MNFLKRFREASTWAGVAGLVTVFNPALGLTLKGIIAAASSLAIIIPEGKGNI